MTNDGNELDDELKQLLRTKYPKEDASCEVTDFLFAGTPLVALLYRELFWPTFVEIAGMVFWKGTVRDSNDVERVHRAFEEYDRDIRLTERAFNFIEVPELFATDPEDVSRELLDDLTRTLCETWKARLESTFPEKRFVVDFEPADDETGEECGLWFYQA